MNRFSGKVALVTGAGSGIGRATAQRLSQEGADLYLADINEAGLDETRALLAGGGRVASSRLDVGEPDDCRRVVDDCAQSLGGIDVLCNIAGVLLTKHLTDISDDDWNRLININLNGVFYMCRAAIPHLLEREGNIINMASSAGRGGQAYNAAYCASKAGVVMLTKSIAIEYSKQNVRCNSVCPGGVITPIMNDYQLPEDANMEFFNRLASPLQPYAQPEEIAACIAYLASSEARYVTGVDFAIDGGQTAS